MKDSTTAGATPGTVQDARSPTEQMQALDDAEINRQQALMRMLIEDAREGRVKDPEQRNAKGRHEAKFKPTKVGRRTPDPSERSSQRASEAEASSILEASDSDSSASSAIVGAADSLRRLGDALDSDSEKLVERHMLV